ncbi:MAG TPA: hypothetical protein DER01_12785 [Phycisphaerales bacterium]|nr:hypothetical protein [Phycisphaerales bacterium]
MSTLIQAPASMFRAILFQRSQQAIQAICLTVVTLSLMLSVPRHAQAQPEGYAIGINDHVLYRNNAELDTTLSVYDDSSTKFVRINIDWRTMEPAKNTYNTQKTAALDYYFQKCADRGIRVLVSIAYAPAWANGGHEQMGWPPINPVDYADFCQWFVEHFAHYQSALGQRTLEAIEIWNEPDLCDMFFRGYDRYAPEAATKYAQMVKVAGGRIQTVRNALGANDILILAPVISDTHNVSWKTTGSWIDAFYAVQNVTDYYDVFSWHSYWMNAGSTGWLPPELPPCFSTTNQQRSIMGKLTSPLTSEIWHRLVANGDHLKPNWCTEIGGSAKSATPDHANRYLSFAEQQTHLTDIINVLHNESITNLQRVYWYEIFDEPHLGSSSESTYGMIALNNSNPITYTGTIPVNTADRTPKPVYSTYVNADKGTGTTTSAFFDDFNDGYADGWTAMPGTWQLVNNALVNPHNANTATCTLDFPYWTNSDTSLAIRFTDPWKKAGVIARYDGSQGYYLRLAGNSIVKSHKLELLVNQSVVVSSGLNDVYDLSNFQTLRISVIDEVNGTRIKGFINGNEHINYLDTSMYYASGQLALRAEPWTGTVTVDDVTVSE